MQRAAANNARQKRPLPSIHRRCGWWCGHLDVDDDGDDWALIYSFRTEEVTREAA